MVWNVSPALALWRWPDTSRAWADHLPAGRVEFLNQFLPPDEQAANGRRERYRPKKTGDERRQHNDQLGPLLDFPSRAATGGLVLLNGVWSKAPELQPQIANLARRTHVMVADPAIFPFKSLFEMSPPTVHLVTVSPARECPEWLHVEVQVP
jgi:hypothetical protein